MGHTGMVAACAGSAPGRCSGSTLSDTADTQIFHCCGNFLVRFLGTELDVMALGLKGDKAA